MKTTYEDQLITCDAGGITIRRYYFPLGTAKRIRWADIKSYQVHGGLFRDDVVAAESRVAAAERELEEAQQRLDDLQARRQD